MPDAVDLRVYPVFLKLTGRAVLVVGAGAVAERKVASLLEAGARVRVVAPHATDEIRRLAAAGSVEWTARDFNERDADDAWLIVAATSDGDVQRQVAEAAAARRIFVVAVDDPANASAYGGAIVARPPFTIAISSSGSTPALTRLLREILELVLPEEEWVEHAKKLRARWRADGTPIASRFGELVREFAARSASKP
jgi:uroporphyrin-III C-methyltransferase/precorrin-2 dehydrogenase/sirohydrochlorin ferrochelatase